MWRYEAWNQTSLMFIRNTLSHCSQIYFKMISFLAYFAHRFCSLVILLGVSPKKKVVENKKNGKSIHDVALFSFFVCFSLQATTLNSYLLKFCMVLYSSYKFWNEAQHQERKIKRGGETTWQWRCLKEAERNEEPTRCIYELVFGS